MAHEPETADVIVIGGGVAGLAAARELSRGRLRVILLEARPRLGGRIDTRLLPHWPVPVERGAEFVHSGNADLWRILREARARTRKLPETHWRGLAGRFEKIPDLDGKIGSVTGLIRPGLAGSMSFAAYFRRHPPKVKAEAWMLARGFVEGFEAAPIEKISARSLAGESIERSRQYAVPGGYNQVIARLADDCLRRGGEMQVGAVVRSVKWRRGRVSVVARDVLSGAARRYSARAAVITVPLGVLKARKGMGAIRFDPPLKGKQRWIDRMEMGDVVRMAFRFRKTDWRRLFPGISRRRRPGGFGFIHSPAQGVPVWWSLSDQPVIVGWAGGPAATALLKMPPTERRRKALRSLAAIFGSDPAAVVKGAVDWAHWDWTGDPFSRGAYSFIAAGQDGAGRKLRSAVRDTLFFAGEATAEGSDQGTVHGALSSGLLAARESKRMLGRMHVG